MAGKILVTYASRAGSTVGVAAAIAETLAQTGADVALHPMQDVDGLGAYQAVVAGSAIRIDRWLPEAMAFVKKHQAELNRKPFAAFLVCMAMAAKDPARLEQSRKNATAWLQPVRTLVNPVSEGLFAGALHLHKIPFIYRIPFRLMMLSGAFGEGDYRDWDAIRAWATDLSGKLERRPS